MSVKAPVDISTPEAYRAWRLQQHCPVCAGAVPDCRECHGISAPPVSAGPASTSGNGISQLLAPFAARGRQRRRA